MHIFKLRITEQRTEPDLPFGIVQQVGTANYVGDSLQIIINHYGELIIDNAITALQHKIAQILLQVGTMCSLQAIGEADLLIWYFDTDGLLIKRQIQIPAGSGINMIGAEHFTGALAGIDPALLMQLFNDLFIQL